LMFCKKKTFYQNSNPIGKNSTFIKITTDTRGSELNTKYRRGKVEPTCCRTP
jgi:hypothetical protein